MPSLNDVKLIGRITKDVTLRKTQSGLSVVSFTLAVNRRIKKDEQPKADFFSCQAWRGTADFMVKYVKKGNLLLVDGHLQTRNYNDKDGKRVYVTEVVADSVQFLESKKSDQDEATEALQNDEYPDFTDRIDDDKLPF